MNRRWVCSDVWMDILPNFRRRQLGLKMALLSPHFDVLVDAHFDGKNELSIWNEITIKKMGTKAKLFVWIGRKYMPFPLPDHPLPNKIRFNYLRIEYIDHSVITFLRTNQQIFDKGTKLSFIVYFSVSAKEVQPNWDVFAPEIWPIFAPNIRHFNFTYGNTLENLRRLISPTILSNFNIISIRSDNLLPDVIADDGLNATIVQALSKWLQIPTKDGNPKQLRCCEYGHTYVRDHRAFLSSITSSASCIIRIGHCKSMEIEPFELINERTNEKLTLETEGQLGNQLIIKRYQIGETVQWEDQNLNNVNFILGKDCIGPLVSTGGGPKEPKKSSENE